jgi:hypothetical protein
MHIQVHMKFAMHHDTSRLDLYACMCTWRIIFKIVDLYSANLFDVWGKSHVLFMVYISLYVELSMW